MASVEDRILQMQFDNKQFENNAGTTLSTLDKLKQALTFGHSKSGLEDIAASGRSFNLDNVGSAVEGIASKFSALGAIAFTVLQNITNRAVDAGISLVKSLSFDQIKSGFQEYETNIGAIQTILANTAKFGTTLDDVTASLDELNNYADKTIYNFGDMVKNIGLFTNAGISLEDATANIKGFSNAAAASGVNAADAARAAYQLSQGLSAGVIRLMDWRSLQTAGLGNDNMKTSLLQIGEAMGSVAAHGAKASDIQRDFNGSLEKGWLTADVMSTYLKAMAGDMDAAALSAIGLSDTQVTELLKQQKTAEEAATKVRTFTQLLSTVKEAVGSGWSESFRTIIGDFNETTDLFTNINNVISKFVGNSAQARNELLAGWKFLGGRTMLIDALAQAFKILGVIMNTVKTAFREVFPAMDAFDLLALTQKFKDFVDKMTPSLETIYKIKQIFVGFFSALKIGVEIVKGVFGVIKDLIGSFVDAASPDGGFLGFLVKIANGITDLKGSLVDGGKIKDFFDNLGESVKNFVANFSFDNLIQTAKDVFVKVKDAIVSAFTDNDTVIGQAVGGIIDRVKDRFSWVTTATDGIINAWQWVAKNLGKIKDKLGDFGTFLSDTFGGIPQKVADVLSKSDYSTALDTLNTGLFGGFLLLFKRFSDNGLGFSGLVDGIGKSLEGLTGVLSAMQANLKAEALMKIATAIALITGSVLILSLIDSAALTKALAAIAIGMGQLVTAMALLNKVVTGPKDAAKLATLSASLIVLAGALVILSVAMKIMSTMSWEELAKGLIGVTGLLGVLALTMKPLTKNSSGLITTGIGLIALGVGLNLLAGAVKIFATMSWEELGKGMAGVASGLLIVAAAMNLMPPTSIFSGLALIPLAIGLTILAGAVSLFSLFEWDAMGKGMAGIAAGLLIIAGAMNLMPPTMILSAAGLVLVGIALASLAGTLKIFGSMSWSSIGRGLVAMTGLLLIIDTLGALAIVAAPGAVALGVMALALKGLAAVLQTFAGMSWGDMLKGLGGLAITIGALALGSSLILPLVPAMLALGVALGVIGVGLVVFGAGAYLAAAAFAIIATAGSQGVATLVSALKVITDALPAFVAALGTSLLALGGKILEALPDLISKMGVVIGSILQVVIDNIPKFAQAFGEFIDAGIGIVTEKAPSVIAAGFKVLLDLLKGIRDNIKEIVTVAVDIVTNFIDGLTEKLPQIIDSGYNFVKALINGILEKLIDVNLSGVSVISEFLKGIAGKIFDVVGSGVSTVTNWISGIVGKAFDIAQAGIGLIGEFLGGIADALVDVVRGAGEVISSFLGGIDDFLTDIFDKGKEIAGQIVAGILKGIKNGAKAVKDSIVGMAKDAWDGVTGFLGINSPSKLFIGVGESIAEGMVVAFDKDTTVKKGAIGLVNRATDAISDSLATMPSLLNGLGEFNPVITPVIDLSQVTKGAAQLSLLMGQNGSITADVSYNQASALASETSQNTTPDTSADIAPVVKEIRFEQNNYSPQALSTADMYRQTRSQIAMAKEELAVL